MTDSYKIWKPEHDGHAPPHWREGMKWTRRGLNLKFDAQGHPEWLHGWEYRVEPEALNSPNDDAVKFVANVPSELSEFSDGHIVRFIQSWDDERKAKHGITLAPERDWATELWADLMETADMKIWVRDIRKGNLRDYDQAAIALIRERVVLKEARND